MVPRATRRSTPVTATNPAKSLVRSSVERMVSALISLLLQLEPRHLGAFVEHLEIALHRVAADLKRMRLAGPAARQHPDLGSCAVKFRLVRHQDGGAAGGGCGRKFPCGIDVGIEMRHVVDEVELGTSRK